MEGGECMGGTKMKPADFKVGHVQHMESEEEGQKQSHYLNINPPACLDRQGVHDALSARAPGQGEAGWVEAAVFMVLWVWLI